MAFVELILGWLIVTALGIGSIVAAEPFWGPGRPRDSAVVVRLEIRNDDDESRQTDAAPRRAA